MSGKLKMILVKTGGRDNKGQVAVRHIGGRHKRMFRVIDFRRDKTDMAGKVVTIEYDPNRTADIALVHYTDGEKRYIIAPLGLSVGDSIISSDVAEIKPGNSLPLAKIPVGTVVHNVELTKGKGGQLVRGAGGAAVVLARESGFIHVKMPSGEVRRIHEANFATVGQIGNVDWKNVVLGKAGKSRHLGIRPTVRGVAMNPRSHPHGGGEGRSGIGMKYPKTYVGRRAVGNTRNKKKHSSKFIVSRRKRSS